MAAPCRKCGATKTESVPHGSLYKLAKKFGYRLRKCSRCQRKRLLRLHESTDSPPKTHTHHEPVEAVEPEPKGTTDTQLKPRDACPRCWKKDYRRSRRRWWERALGRPAMVRCRVCRHRFALPSRPASPN